MDTIPKHKQSTNKFGYKWSLSRGQCQGICARNRKSISYDTLLSQHKPTSVSCFAQAQSNIQESSSSQQEGYIDFEGHKVRYLQQNQNKQGPAVMLVHGFGASADHWRQNMPELSKTSNVAAIDLLGYGYSDKPDPSSQPKNTLYNFDTWARQVITMCESLFPNQKVLLISNSIGGLAILRAAALAPNLITACQVQNISLRKLHSTKQSPLARPLVTAFQNTLRNTPLGEYFFNQIAEPQAIANVLKQAYPTPGTVTDTLVQNIYNPSQTPGAARVFLDFISYSSGPLPEDLLEQSPVPVSMLWGERDPWEPLDEGRELGKARSVQEFVVLPGLGHCPHDEAPGVVNPYMMQFIKQYAGQ